MLQLKLIDENSELIKEIFFLSGNPSTAGLSRHVIYLKMITAFCIKIHVSDTV